MLPRNESAPRRGKESDPSTGTVPGSAARRLRGHANWNAGFHAEVLAGAALERDGWTVLRRRARTPAGEIDLVVERVGADGPLLAFVEVKRRERWSEAAAALGARQANRLLRAAELLLAAEPGWADHAVRFDLLLVDRGGGIRRIEDVLRLEN